MGTIAIVVILVIMLQLQGQVPTKRQRREEDVVENMRVHLRELR